MVSLTLRLVLLSFAVIAFAGAGASLAVIRMRRVTDGDLDWGMAGVATLLVCFAALCTALGAGWAGVPALGGVAVWASYVFMAQHVGLFSVDAGQVETFVVHPEEHRSTQ